MKNFIYEMNNCKVGEYSVNVVQKDGMMEGYDLKLYNEVKKITISPIIALGGAGDKTF